MPDDFPHRDAIRAVEQLLEDPDKDFRAFEDYRNFHTFEIHMEDVETGKRTRWETRRGTGVRRGNNRFHSMSQSAPRSLPFSGRRKADRPVSAVWRPALFDEAFSKLDGKKPAPDDEFLSGT